MKEEIKQQIALEANIWLDAWIPLDWARANLMLGRIEESLTLHTAEGVGFLGR